MFTTVVTHGDAPPVFQFGKHIFYFVAFFIEDGIVGDEVFPVFLGRDTSRNAFGFQRRSEPIGIIAAIGDHLFGLGELMKQHGCAFVVAHLSFGEQQGNGLAVSIAHGVQF